MTMMATRWSRRRLLATFIVLFVVSLLYTQHKNAREMHAWKSQMGGETGSGQQRPVAPPASGGGRVSTGSGSSSGSSSGSTKDLSPPSIVEQKPIDDIKPPEKTEKTEKAEKTETTETEKTSAEKTSAEQTDGKFEWSKFHQNYPIPPAERKTLPKITDKMLQSIPQIQFEFPPETEAAKAVRLERLALVKSNFTHAWTGYKAEAWLQDEVRPVRGGGVERFGGWAATLVDSLDTLWIMGMTADFEEAVAAIDKIDFTNTTADEINVFETTIRYLGGFLAAYDLSDGQYPLLLRKAVELGDMLYAAFDTPNHLPVLRWKMADAQAQKLQVAPMFALVSEPGSLSVEFTRLSQLSGDQKYYDAVQRIMELYAAQQEQTNIPGLWPIAINLHSADLTGGTAFSIGGMADSVYEYLPKQYLMLGGADDMYRSMYIKSLAAMERHIFFHPRTPSTRSILFPGDKYVGPGETKNIKQLRIRANVQHLGCFAGGMVGLGARLFQRPEDMEMARQLVEGCIWAYEAAPNGIMPEIFRSTLCPKDGEEDGTTLAGKVKTSLATTECGWDEAKWHEGVRRGDHLVHHPLGPDGQLDVDAAIRENRLVPGMLAYIAKAYILRPEAIESVFILYRLTGDVTLLDRAWGMFEAIVRATTTKLAHSAVVDITAPNPQEHLTDSMESFWLAETLKYFYLMFSTPDVVSLDEYVLNTEAHPLKRPTAATAGTAGVAGATDGTL